jgi:hypothetical protein
MFAEHISAAGDLAAGANPHLTLSLQRDGMIGGKQS